MDESSSVDSTKTLGTKRRYNRAVGPRLRWILNTVWALLALLGANSVYLLTVTLMTWLERDQGISYQNYFYQLQFLGHLIVGLLFIVPFLAFNVVHIRNTWNRPNRKAVYVGYALFLISLVVLVSGIVLVRFDGLEFIQIKSEKGRSIAYWAHVVAPLLCVWLYILHRLAGPRIRWNVGLTWGGAVVAAVAGMIALHRHDPRISSAKAPVSGEKYFMPSSARTSSGSFIQAKALMNDQYCLECHPVAYNSHIHSAHKFSSFNNPFYLATIKGTRDLALARDGSVQMSRWCAGCHDPVPFFSGAFDDPDFDMLKHPTSQAGITCVACHSITRLEGSEKGHIGNANYTIEEPVQYPFAFSPKDSLAFFVNKQLIKGKPQFHKQTFLKPFHKTAEFCSVCHKVGIPKAVNKYKEFLRGQNHYDSYLLSGVSGVNARAFYYPDQAKLNCAECHMPLEKSDDFAAKRYGTNDHLSVHSHFFPSANTAVASTLISSPIDRQAALQKHQAFLKDCIRVDIFGVKEGGTIDGHLIAPLRPSMPRLKPGQTYLIETVVRTLRLGHPLTQGTVDSNELWADVEVTDAGRTIGRSGARGRHGEVDPWAHFLNAYMLDREGQRIDQRNAQDIFTPLYNNQIPPGAAHVLHYRLTVPKNQTTPLTVDVKVQYRKFDAIYFNYVYGSHYKQGAPFQVTNDLPISLLASDRLTFEIEGGFPPPNTNTTPVIPLWQRWNDYGIGLFLKGDRGSEKGELIQAADAFTQVERLGRADGALNLARVFFKEGRLDETVHALQRAGDTNRFTPAANRWTTAWLSGLVNKQNGFLDDAIRDLKSILEDRYPELDRRGLNFSRDYEVINELGQALFERAKMERARPEMQRDFLRAAAQRFEETLLIDSENLTAHYNLGLIHASLNDPARSAKHRQLHERYRPDDNARDRAVAIARRAHPPADHAAQAIVIYDLQRPEALSPP